MDVSEISQIFSVAIFLIIFFPPFLRIIRKVFKFLTTPNPDFLLKIAEARFESNDFINALEICQGIVNNDPANERAWYVMGLAFEKCGRVEEALACYNKILDLNPSHPNALNNKGAILFQLKKYPEAIECFKDAFFLGNKDAKRNIDIIRGDPRLLPFHDDLNKWLGGI